MQASIQYPGTVILRKKCQKVGSISGLFFHRPCNMWDHSSSHNHNSCKKGVRGTPHLWWLLLLMTKVDAMLFQNILGLQQMPCAPSATATK